MPWKFNPFSVTLDQTGSGGGGGAQYLDGEVATYNDLPLDGTAAADSAWLVRSASGSWLTGRRPAGIYIRTATAGVSRDADYTYAGIFPDVFSDANFTLYDDGDATKTAQFQLSGITTGTNRVLTVPDASGTIALLSNFLTAVKGIAVVAPSSDYTVNNNNVPSNVPGASFSVSANTSYVIVSAAQLSNAFTSGHDVLVNVPSLDQVSGGSVGGFGIYVTGNNLLTSAVTYDATTLRLLARGAAQTGMSFSIVVLRVGGTGGTANIQFCQNSAQANNSTLLATSRFLVIPIST